MNDQSQIIRALMIQIIGTVIAALLIAWISNKFYDQSNQNNE